MRKIVKTPFERTVMLAAAVSAMLLFSGCISLYPPEEARSSSVKGAVAKPVLSDTAAYEAYRLVNEERLRRGLLALSRRPELDDVAMAHCRDLLRMNQLSHVSSDGRKLENRMARLNWSRAGENLARNKGYESPSREAVRGWIASPKHYENMFRADFSETGMAALYDPETGFTYFVQVFVVPA